MYVKEKHIYIKLKDISASLGDVSASLGDVSASLGDVSASLGDVSAKLGDISASLGDVSASLGDVSAKLGDVSAKLGDVSAKLGDVSAKLGDVSAKLGDIFLNSVDVFSKFGAIFAKPGDVFSGSENVFANFGDIFSNSRDVEEAIYGFIIGKNHSRFGRNVFKITKKEGMSSKHYIPRRDAEFNILQDNVIKDVSENAAAWLVPQALIEGIDVPRRKWNEAYATYCDPAKRTHSVVQQKNDARKAYESLLRVFIQGQVMHNPRVSGADRLSMGLSIYDRTPTLPAPPATRPEIEVDFSQIVRHILHVRDSRTKSAGKPPHVIGFEIWYFIGPVCPDYGEMSLRELATRSPHTLAYNSIERGRTAWYAVRWVNTRGEKGPWSEIVSAIIA